MKLLNLIKNMNQDDAEDFRDTRNYWWNDLPDEPDQTKDLVISMVQERGSQVGESSSASQSKKFVAMAAAKKRMHEIISERIIDFQGHNNSIQALCVSLRSNELFSGGADCNIMVWDLTKGYIKCTMKGHQGSVNCLTYSQKLNFLASGSSDSTIRVWNLDTFEHFNTIPSKAGPVLSLVYSHKEDKLIAACAEVICIWELPNNELIMMLSNEKNLDIYCLTLSNRDQILFSGHEAHVIRIWRIDQKEGSLMETLYGHSAGVTTLSLSKDNTVLLSGSKDKSIRVWQLRYLECIRDTNTVDYKVEATCIRAIQDSEFGIEALVLDPKEQFFFATGADNLIRKYTFNSEFKMTSVLKGHSNEVYALCFHPDGSFLFSGGLDITIKGWAVEDNSMAHNFEGHAEGICSVRMDSREEFMISGGSDCLLKLWDIDKRRCVKILEDHTGKINDILISRNRDKFYSASSDTTIKIWKLKDDFKCMHSLYDHRGPVNCLALTHKGHLLFSGSSDKTIKMWDTNTLEVKATLEEHDKEVTALVLSQNERFLFSGGADAKIMIWLIKERSIIDTMIDHQGTINRLLVSGGQYSLFSCSADKTIKAWSIEERTCKRTLKGHKGEVHDISLNSENTILYSASADTTVKIWDVATGNCINTFYKHEDSVTTIYRMRKSNRFVTGSLDRSIKIWGSDIPESTVNAKGHQRPITKLAISQNGQVLVSASEDSTIKFWDTDLMICGKTVQTDSAVVCGNIDMDETVFLVGNADCTLNAWRLEDQISDFKVSMGTEPVSCIAFGETSELIFTGFKRTSGVIRVTHRMNGEFIRELVGHKAAVTSLVCGKKDEYLFSGSMDRDILVWNLQSLEIQHTLKGHGDLISSLFIDPRNLYLYSGSADKNIKVWAMLDFSLIVTLNGHEADVNSVLTSHDGSLLFSGSADKTIKVWKTEDFTLVITLEGHTGGIRSMAISPDSKRLFSGGDDGIIRVWNFATLLSISELDLNSLESLMNYMIAETYQDKERCLIDFIFCLEYCGNSYYVRRINPVMFLTTLNYPKVLEYALNTFGYPKMVVDREDDLLYRVLKDEDKKRKHLDTVSEYLIRNNDQIKIDGDLIDKLVPENSIKVQKFLQFMFQKGVEPQQGSYLERKGKLRMDPICVPTEGTKFISMHDQSQVNKRGKHLETIDYLITKFKIDLRNGSECSRNFFRNLDEENKELVLSDYTHLINYKWRILKPFINLHAFGFWLLILVMALHIIIDQKSIPLVVLCILFNVIYVIYELICAWGEFFSHLFRDMNWLDLFCYLFNFFTLAVIWSIEDVSTLKQIVLVLDIIFYFIRGITYLRIFKQTRYLISMILRVFFDIVSFLVILSLFIFGLAMIAYEISILNEDDTTLTFGKAITICYLLALGEFSDWEPKKNFFSLAEFIVATIILTLVMLNLLIAIISNAYEEVKAEREYFDLKEKLSIISDFENFLHKLTRRKSLPEHYKYQIIAFYPSPSSEQEMIQELITRVSSLETNLVDRLKVIESKTDTMYQLLRISRKSE